MNKFFKKTPPGIIYLCKIAQFSGYSLETGNFFVDFTETAYLNTSLAVFFKIEKGERII
jgi:hypothetical protein